MDLTAARGSAGPCAGAGRHSVTASRFACVKMVLSAFARPVLLAGCTRLGGSAGPCAGAGRHSESHFAEYFRVPRQFRALSPALCCLVGANASVVHVCGRDEDESE